MTRYAIPTKKAKRPFGINVIIILQLINAIIVFAILSAVVAEYGDVKNELSTLDTQEVAELTSNLALEVFYAVTGLVIAIGLFRMKYWAWIAIMIWTGSRMVGNLIEYFDGYPVYMAMLRNVIIVFYLNQRTVRQTYYTQVNEINVEV